MCQVSIQDHSRRHATVEIHPNASMLFTLYCGGTRAVGVVVMAVCDLIGQIRDIDGGAVCVTLDNGFLASELFQSAVRCAAAAFTERKQERDGRLG